MIRVNCQCGKVLNVKDEHAGKKGKCPSCGAMNLIPQLPSAAPQSPMVAATPVQRVVAKAVAPTPVKAKAVAAVPVAAKVAPQSAIPVAQELPMPASSDDGLFSNLNIPLEDLNSSYDWQKPKAEENPNRAPQTTLSSSYSARARERSSIETASIGSRFGNSFIDNIVLQVIGYGIGIAFAGSAQLNSKGEVEVPGMLIVVSILVSLGYFWVLELTTGQTIGKMATGTRVVDKYGNKPNIGQITIRTLARCIILLDWLCVLGKERRCLHDILSGTYVV